MPDQPAGAYRVRCERCGPVRVAASEVRLAVPAGGAAFYTFRCPLCGRASRRPADPDLAALLRAGGAAVIEAHPGG